LATSPISEAIVAVIVRMGINRALSESGIIGAFPVTIITVIVSPIVRPTPNIIAVRIPDFAAGTVTVQIVCQRVTPNASDACRYVSGTLFSASSEIDTIVGMAIPPSNNEPVKAVNPVGKFKTSRINGDTTSIPRKPRTTLGSPANNSTSGFKIFPAHRGAISAINTAVNTPNGMAIREAPNVTTNDPNNNGRIPKYDSIGYHLWLNRSESGTVNKAGTPSEIKKYNINNTNNIEENPENWIPLVIINSEGFDFRAVIGT